MTAVTPRSSMPVGHADGPVLDEGGTDAGRTGSLAPGAAGAAVPGTRHGGAGTPRRSRTVAGAPRWLWRQLTSKRTALTLILTLVLLTLAGTLLDQVPDEVRGDPAARAAWLDSVRPRYRGLTDLLAVAGLFAVFHSVWFAGVSGLLAASTLACTANRAPGLWRRARRPRPDLDDEAFRRAGLQAGVVVPGGVAEAVEQVRTTLRRRGFRVVVRHGEHHVDLDADRFRLAPLATIVAHAGLVLVLVGVAVTSTMGFRDPQSAVTVGSRVAVGHGTGLAVEAVAFSDTYDLDGAPLDYASDLVVYRDGRRVAARTVRVNQPLRVDGVSFTQSYYGTAAVVRVTDGNGGVLFDGGVPLQWASDDLRYTLGRFVLDAPRLTVDVVGPASGRSDPGIGPGQVRLQLHGDGDRVSTALVSAGEPVTVDGLTYTFVRERPFTGLSVARDPGKPIVWLGFVLLVLGMSVTFGLRHRRVRVLVRRPGGDGVDPAGGGGDACAEIRLVSPRRHDEASWFQGLVRSLQGSAGPSSRSATPSCMEFSGASPDRSANRSDAHQGGPAGTITK